MSMHDKLDSVRKERRELYEKYGQVVWAIANNTYNHVYAIEKMQDLCAMMQQKNVVLVGSAGNGKTSLLCRMSEVAIGNLRALLNLERNRLKCALIALRAFAGVVDWSLG